MSVRKVRRSAAYVLAVGALTAAMFAAAGTAEGRPAVQNLSGAGSTLVAPLISVWTPKFKSFSGINITYNSIGSGGGIQSIQNRQVDFGASDAPLTPDQFSNCHGCKQFPWALSAVAVIFNVPGVPSGLRLSPIVVSKIFLGQITTWNNAQIKQLNPGKSLPSTKITTVHRSDGSGTTFAFTQLLAKVNATFKSKVGNSTLVNWPNGIGAKGNPGVSGTVAGTAGTIGYVGVDYSAANHLKTAALRNNAGQFIQPTLSSISLAAGARSGVPSNNAIDLTNPPASARGAYPDATYTYVIVPIQTSKALELKELIKWAVTKGQAFANALSFAHLPAGVTAAVLGRINAIHT